MESSMKPKGTKSINYYIRGLHRDLGFFAVGMIVIYALSGILLIYRDTDAMKVDTRTEKKLTPGLEAAELGKALRLRDFNVTGAEGEILLFKEGNYNKTTGMATYTLKELPVLLNKFTGLHKAVSKNPTHWFNIIFGLVLLFMALSSFWMFKKENKNFRRGLFIAGGGILFVVILLLL